jgi:hypothetical protein
MRSHGSLPAPEQVTVSSQNKEQHYRKTLKY